MKKYIVTGGAGFIGSALVRTLLSPGDATVAVIDNLSTGHRRNLDEVVGKIALHQVDIRDFSSIQKIVAGADTVFHIAAVPSVPKSIVDPVPSHESNIDGTFNVLRACVEGKVRKVVYAASSSAYGDTLVLPRSSWESITASPFLPATVSTPPPCVFSTCMARARTPAARTPASSPSS